LPSGYVGWISEGGPTHSEKASRPGCFPELLVETAYQPGKPAQQQATADLTMIAFYYLLRAGEYTIKGSRNSTKQTVQFKYEDVSFFKKNTRGQLQCLPRDAPAELICTADGATLKLDNQKNRWKGVCVYHETNGDLWHCPIRALARQYIHLQSMGADAKTYLSMYHDDKGKRGDITNEDISRALKAAATMLDYPNANGIPIDRIDMHSCAAVAPMPSPWQDIRTPKSKRWVAGRAQLSRNTSVRNSHVSRKGCQLA